MDKRDTSECPPTAKCVTATVDWLDHNAQMLRSSRVGFHSGWHSRDAEVAALQAEVDRLRDWFHYRVAYKERGEPQIGRLVEPASTSPDGMAVRKIVWWWEAALQGISVPT